MKRTTLLLSLLSLFVLIGVAQADEPAGVAADAALSEVLSTPAECGEVDILANLFAPPIMQMGYTDSCGACSVSQCRGARRGQPCGYDVWCIPTLTNFCPGTQDWDCQCAHHYE